MENISCMTIQQQDGAPRSLLRSVGANNSHFTWTVLVDISVVNGILNQQISLGGPDLVEMSEHCDKNTPDLPLNAIYKFHDHS